MSSFRKPMKAYRPAVGSYSDGGVWQPGIGQTEISITASVQAPQSRDLLALPEDRRDRVTYVLFTDTRLQPASVEQQRNADVVPYAGEYFEVAAVNEWQNGVIPHYRVVIQKVTGPTDITINGEAVPGSA